MKYEIWGDVCPAVTITLKKNESVFTDQGGISWMSDKIMMSTSREKGFRSVKSKVPFLAEFRAMEDDQELTISATRAGKIVEFNISDGNYIIGQRAQFLCCEEGVNIYPFLANFTKNLPGGEGYHLQQYEGNGKVFMEMLGSVKEYELSEGESFRIVTGNLAAWEDTVHFEVKNERSFKSMLFGGKGALISTVTGPGKVWIQTAPISELAKRVIPYVKED